MNCKRHEREVGPISWNGNCGSCAVSLMETALTELHEHRGPTFDRWRVRLAASVGAVIPER